MDPDALAALLEEFRGRGGPLCVLTGAGISAESGVPTFRGPEGYWKVGSENYHPQTLATQRMFRQQPREVWRWYLYRSTVCRRATPNAGHTALVRLEQKLAGRFVLVTQNVDGLHTRAGSRAPYEIHGNIDRYRCSARCSDRTHRLPEEFPAIERDTPLADEVFASLRCPDCGEPARPHVLWFDECYEESLFRSQTAYAAAAAAALLVVVGTSGSTNLPMQIGAHCARAGTPMIDVNLIDNPFGQLAEASGGLTVRAPAAEVLPRIASMLGAT